KPLRISQQSTNRKIFRLPLKLIIALRPAVQATPPPKLLPRRCRSDSRRLRQSKSAALLPAGQNVNRSPRLLQSRSHGSCLVLRPRRLSPTTFLAVDGDAHF